MHPDTYRVIELLYIRKRKRAAGSGFWGAYLTAEDRFGIWLFTPRGSLYRDEGCDGNLGFFNVGSPTGSGIPVIHLLPRDEWWIATFWPEEARWPPTFDISTPPRLDGAVWTFDDLELDILMDRQTGATHLDDMDEFDAAIAAGFISDGEAAAAQAVADAVVDLLADPREAFATLGDRRLHEALSLELAPITDLP